MISDLRLQAKTRRVKPTPPLRQFLQQSLKKHAADNSGAVADYIPELTKANPAHFGISLATIDGYVYEVGDSAIPFTIQSISKAFVFALALETVGAKAVEETIGVEPSGDAFNSIRLNSANRPFNAMVNSGAIACSGLIYKAEGRDAFECIRESLSRFAGRQLSVDNAVFLSECATGDRNRAIAYLLRTYSVIEGDVDAVLDVYFRQCSILVTARDLAVMCSASGRRDDCGSAADPGTLRHLGIPTYSIHLAGLQPCPLGSRMSEVDTLDTLTSPTRQPFY